VDGGGSFDVLLNLFESITTFLHRLDIYIKIPPTAAMTEIAVKIVVELLSTLALEAEQMRRGRGGGYRTPSPIHHLTQCGAERVLDESEVNAMLGTLDRLAQDEARMAAAHTLQLVYSLVQDMRVVAEGEQTSPDCYLYSPELLSH
jgi:hypothetical protein